MKRFQRATNNAYYTYLFVAVVAFLQCHVVVVVAQQHGTIRGAAPRSNQQSQTRPGGTDSLVPSFKLEEEDSMLNLTDDDSIAFISSEIRNGYLDRDFFEERILAAMESDDGIEMDLY